MATTSVNLIGDLAIVQGKTFEKIDLRFPGDVSLWIPHAQVRNRWHYKEVGQTPVVEFTFPPLLYDATSDKTLVRPRLSAVQTAAIHPTKYQGEVTPTSGSTYVWDLELTEPGTGRVIGLDWGYVQVKPEATVI